jgi:Domain of unknown function (DUF4365)/SHNi-TPR
MDPIVTTKPKVPWTTRLGTIGEAQVKARLAYFSIATKYETDPGIDFYCELLENDSPSLPFFVQAKGTEHFDAQWGQSIPKPTLVYWLQQPAPVFLMVYDEVNKLCYWMSIEELRYRLIEQIFTTESATVYMRMDRTHALELDRNLNQGLIDRIKQDTTLVQLFRGQAVFRGDGYVKQLPSPPRSELEVVRIKENVRAGLYSLVQHCSVTQDITGAKLYCDFLADFDSEHYNHFVWLGEINLANRNYPEAVRNFRRALEICEADKVWPRESLQPIIDAIKEHLQKLE